MLYHKISSDNIISMTKGKCSKEIEDISGWEIRDDSCVDSEQKYVFNQFPLFMEVCKW